MLNLRIRMMEFICDDVVWKPHGNTLEIKCVIVLRELTVPSKAKPLVQDTEDNWKGFHTYVASKKRLGVMWALSGRKQETWLLWTQRRLGFSVTSVPAFNGTCSSHTTQIKKGRCKDCEDEDPEPSVGDQVSGHLSHLNVHKSWDPVRFILGPWGSWQIKLLSCYPSFLKNRVSQVKSLMTGKRET